MIRRLTRSTAVCLTLSALAGPAALADPHAAELHAGGEAAPRQDLRSPDARDAGQGRGTYTAPNVMIVKVPEPVPAEGGVDWADAGMGAGGMLGVMLLGLGGLLGVVHRRQAAARHGI